MDPDRVTEEEEPQMTSSEKKLMLGAFLIKYILLFVIWVVMFIHGFIPYTKQRILILKIIGLLIMVVVFMNNKTNIAETYGIRYNPYGNFTSTVNALVSFINNFLIYMLKSVYIILGVFIVFNLIGQSVELHSQENIKLAITKYVNLYHAFKESGGALGALMAVIMFIFIALPLFIVLITHLIGFLLAHLKLLLGLTVTNHFTKKIKKDSTRVTEWNNEAYEIYRPLYGLMNLKVTTLKDLSKSMIVIGSILSIIIGGVAATTQTSEGFNEDTVVRYMDYQMAIRWVIVVILIIQFFLDSGKDLRGILDFSGEAQQNDYQAFRKQFTTKTIQNLYTFITIYVKGIMNQSDMEQMMSMMDMMSGDNSADAPEEDGAEKDGEGKDDNGDGKSGSKSGKKKSQELRKKFGKIQSNDCWDNLKKSNKSDIDKLEKLIKEIEKEEKQILKIEKDIQKLEEKKKELEDKMKKQEKDEQGEAIGKTQSEIDSKTSELEKVKKDENDQGTKIDGIVKEANQIIDTLSNEIKKIAKEDCKGTFEKTKDAVSEKIGKAKDAVSGKIDEVKGAVSGKIDKAKDAVSDKFNEAKDAVKGAFASPQKEKEQAKK